MKKIRFFLKRSSKVAVLRKTPVVIPFPFATLLLLILFIFISLFLFLRSDIFQVKSIVITSKIPECATEEGIKFTSEAVGTSIIFYDLKLAERKILEKFYCIAQAGIIKKYPDSLEITISERIPIAALVEIDLEPAIAVATQSVSILATNSAIFAIDKQGILFQNLPNNSALPKVFASFNLKIPGQITAQEISWLLEFLQAAEKFNLAFDKFTKTSEGFFFGETQDGIKLILSPRTEAAKTASSLQAILRQAKIEGAKFTTLDLRFEKPVIR